MLPRRHRRTSGIAIIGLSMIMVLAIAAPAAAKKNPAGNNGTVKIDRVAFDDHPNNEPHVGCRFQVDFYGFDENASYVAQVVFELHAPTAAGRSMTVTSGDLTPFIGEDDNSWGGSEAGLDAAETYTLAFTGQSHPQQGYHVKLTVHAPGSQGADTKHKVFWVTGCDPAGVVPPSNPSGPDPRGTPPDGNPPATTPPSTAPEGGTPNTPSDGGTPNTPPREDTAGSSGAEVLLPDTALARPIDPAIALLVGALMVAGSAARVAVAVRHSVRR